MCKHQSCKNTTTSTVKSPLGIENIVFLGHTICSKHTIPYHPENRFLALTAGYFTDNFSSPIGFTMKTKNWWKSDREFQGSSQTIVSYIEIEITKRISFFGQSHNGHIQSQIPVFIFLTGYRQGCDHRL